MDATMNNELDEATINALNEKREKHISNMNIQKQLSSMRSNQMNTGSPLEQTGLGGIWSDVKGLPMKFARGVANAIPKAPHAIGQLAGQAMDFPGEYAHIAKKAFTGGQYDSSENPKLTANLLKGGINLFNEPGNFLNYLGKKEIIPKNLGHYIQAHHPDYGLKPEEENPIAQALPGLGLTTADSLLGLPLTKGMAARPLRIARREGERRGVGPLNIPEHIFEEAQQYLPESHANRNLIQSAQQGGYNPLFTLQSDLGKAGTSLTRSLSGAERLHGRAAHDLRQNLISSIREELTRQGHGDLAELMRKGQRNYRINRRIAKPILGTAAALALGHHPISIAIKAMKEFL